MTKNSLDGTDSTWANEEVQTNDVQLETSAVKTSIACYIPKHNEDKQTHFKWARKSRILAMEINSAKIQTTSNLRRSTCHP